MKKIFLLLTLLTIIFSVNAVRVGIVTEFPDGEILTECLETAEETNGYDVLESSSLIITWSAPSEWGHALCAINEIGCPSDDCFCSSDYWGFYTKEITDSSWEYSPTGFDGGSSCSEHYCAQDGDLLGFGYGIYGTEPENYPFENVCFPGDTDANGEVSDFELLTYTDLWAAETVTDAQLLLAINYWSS